MTLPYETVQRLVAHAASAVPIDIEASAVADELRGCETRFKQKVDWVGKHWRQDVFYKGAWWAVGQTSLFDDVATGLCAGSVEEAQTVAKFLNATVFGVRFHRWSPPEDDVVGACSFITHMTDG